MAELTDNLRCEFCGVVWDERDCDCAGEGSGDHVWVVPVAAVAKAIAQLSDNFDRRANGRTVENMAGYYEAVGDFVDLFTATEGED